MKHLITSILLLTSVTISFAQKSDPEAKKILDAVSAKFKTFKSVQSKFSLKIENAAGKAVGTKTGTVYMKGGKYRVSVTGQEIYSDGTNVTTYDKSTNEATITKLDPSTNTLTPQKIFTNFYDKDFLYKLNGESKSGTKTLQEIELTPIDKTKPFFKVLIYVDKVAKTISSVKIFQKTGERITYSVTSFNGKAVLTDDMFTFDKSKYPGVEVVDLR
ncbi:LolA family protein [Ferruginibacter albus]|uniref:LolA family protein n=1 Tax=Ferruginibacter albus TaxID=2875540 RepID=UPI001CC589DE|nr:outer membrane lipoprotein carrier protein LolA [Ferruginibacter albus]UAY51483.1 outer membrane lipoprotein carrier protein LolA [Ferruginibacter albus]